MAKKREDRIAASRMELEYLRHLERMAEDRRQQLREAKQRLSWTLGEMRRIRERQAFGVS
jgi:hypothetical protein